ncbi:MAG: TIR domain-containing protein, partial [Clostridia bacterium]|nr:TIR domain-containing protein [Clostridia bacterium]
MIDLGVRTRANSSPRGKAKVYFCAHPKDFIYLDEICADIFKTQDCAVYYKEDPEAAFEENDWLTFDEIALIVAPITARFLSEDNAPFAAEFAFAKMMKIPVLPLMQESGLETLFNTCGKCKNMQFLDKHKKDATEIPFEEKLQKFLAAVLIGDELAEQIRSEFDGYIFLSYRKKDRKHALDVMRLIHKGDEFRDIAIWYDEYLKPGEDFNDEIKTALEKSDLFTLAVTPNILEKDNYVIKEEYPAAKKLGKRILSAELLPTDRYALKRVFDGLDDPADTRDEAAFYKALSQALDGVERRENDNDPKHNYLIGLAYFSGVDVETDKARGFRMIEDCAKAGYAPAMEKLASAYRYGEGVERDFKKAIAWQSAAAKVCKRDWEAALEKAELAKDWTDDLREQNYAYVKAADTLGDYAMEGGDMETAERAYRDVVVFHEQSRAAFGRFADISAYVFSLKKLGDGYRWSGKLLDAQREYEKSIRFLEKFVEKLDDEEFKLELVSAYEDLGQIHLMLGESVAARDYFEKAVALSERLEIADANAAETQANRYVNTSATAFEFGDYATAIDYADKALR